MPSLSTFGTTLTDLQSGMNAAQGLENQRSNFQDQVAAQRLSDFLRARSDENRTKAQRDAYMAQILESQQARGQQGRQFDAELKNRLDLGQLDAASRKEVATIGAGRTDPRFADTIADIQAQNAKNFQNVQYAKKLSAARKALLAQKNAPMTDEEDILGWKNPAYKKRVDDIDAAIKQLDTQATLLELGVSADGGYVVPDFTEIPVPAMLNPGGSVARPPSSDPGYIPNSPPASNNRLLTPEEAAQLPNGTLYRGLDGRQRRRTVGPPTPPLPVIAPSAPLAASPWDTASQLRSTGRLPAATAAPPAAPQPEGQWVLENGRYVFKTPDPLMNFNLGDFLRQISPRPVF